ncbi:MAG: gamma-glutamyltransferase [Rhizobiales bacterium]|nr:gamma-glutamyltransferase [Hyphomicrobiales bacterium]
MIRPSASNFIAFATFAAFACTGAVAQDAPVYSDMDRAHPVLAKGGMVASQEAAATQIGVDILKAGGNAVDAAVAVGFALAVTLPAAGNLGGGGFMIVHSAQSGETVAIDYREKAPARASRDMFLDPAGNADSKLSQYSGLAAGVPGTVAGLALALERHGTMTLPQVMAPAIRLAEEGVVVTPDLSDSLKGSADELKAWPSSTKIFFKDGGAPFEPGDLLKQADLAKSLRQISEGGPDAFYKGDIARLIADEMARDGGLITLEDMAGYQAVVREPVRGTYRDHEVVSMPPPSSGGVHIIQILNILEGFPIGYLGHNSAETIHLMAEAMKLAYADRSEYLGDSDFVDVPVKGLTSKAYAESLRKKISAGRATASATIKPNDPMPYESDQTTHFSVVDKDGNAVANTYTINFSYGAGVVAEGTGILLNNEMDDFSAKPGVPNAYGLIGGDANAVEPGKRPLSSMSPTIVLKDRKPVIVTGSPGGSRIITTVLQVIMNVVDHGMNVAEASAAPRIHHQWLPDELRVEEGISPDTIRLLEAKGHTVRVQPVMGSTHSIMRRDDGSLFGASDPRRPSALTAGY